MMDQDFIELKVQINTVDLKTAREQLKAVEGKLRALKLNAGLDIGESQKLINKNIDTLSKSAKNLKLTGALDVGQTKTNINSSIDKMKDNFNVNVKVKADLDTSSLNKTKAEIAKIGKSNNAPVSSGVSPTTKPTTTELPLDTSKAEAKLELFKRKMQLMSQQLNQSKSHKVDSSSMDDLLKSVNAVTARTPNLNKVMGDLNMQMKELSQQSKIVDSSMGTALKGMMMWSVAATAFYAPIRAAQSMTDTIITLDTKMTELKKVMADGTDFGSIFNQATESAVKFGQSISDAMDSYIEFAKQGFKGEDLQSLADSGLVASNVGDITAQKASEYMTASLIQWNMDAKESMGIIDSWNNISNQYATTTEKLAQGQAKAGATAKAMGMDFDQLNAVIGTVTAATKQSGNEIGNFMKSSLPRLTSQPAASALAKVGVSLTDDAGNLRDIIEVYKDVAVNMQSLTDTEQISVTEGLAGKYHMTRMQALLDDLGKTESMYDSIYEASSKSDGSALRENETYMKSLQARINSVKVEFEKLAVAIGEAFFTEGMVQFLSMTSSVVQGVTSLVSKLGALPLAFAVITGASLLASKNVRSFGEAFTTVIIEAVKTKTGLSSMNTALDGTATKADVAKGKLKALGATAKATALSFGVFAGIGLAIGAITEAIMGHIQKQRELREEIESDNKLFMEAYSSNAGEVDKLTQRYSELESQINSGKYSSESMTEYLDVQKQLAELLPQLSSGEDAYGNAIVSNAEIIQSRIDLAKEQLLVEKELNAEKAKDKSEDKIEQASKDYKKANGKKKGSLKKSVRNTSDSIELMYPSLEMNIDPKELNTVDKLKTKIEELTKAKAKSAKSGDTADVKGYEYAIKFLGDAITEYGEYENTAKKALLTIRDENLKTLETTLSSAEGISEAQQKAISNVMSTATSDTGSEKTLNAYKKMMDGIASNDEMKSAFSEFSKFSSQMSNSSEEDFNKLSDSAKKSFKSVKKSLLDSSGIDSSSTAYKDYSKSLDKLFASELNVEKASREKAKTDGISIEQARIKIQTADAEGDSTDELTDSITKQIEKLNELSSIEEKLVGVSQNKVEAVNDAIFAINQLTQSTSLNKEQEILLGEQITLLTKLYPALANMLNSSNEQRKKAITIIDAENNANATLIEAYGLVADGKMTAEGLATMKSLEETNKRIKIINGEIGELQKLQQAYEAMMNSEAFNSAQNANDLRTERFSKQNYAAITFKQAELLDITSSQTKYTNTLGSTIAKIKETTSASGKSASAKAKNNKETSKSIYVTDKYKKALSDLNTEQNKQQRIIDRYPTYSKKYRDALIKQIKLKQKEYNLTKGQAKLLATQIKSGKILQTGKQTVDKKSGVVKASNFSSSKSGYNGQYASTINKYAKKYNVNRNLIAAIIKQESGFNKNAKSPAGARGLMQLMPATAKELGVTNSYNADQNIKGGTKYISNLLKKYGGDVEKALRGYNAGMGNVANGKAYKFKETNKYVKKVFDNYNKYLKKAGVSVEKVTNTAVKTMKTTVQGKDVKRKLSGWNGSITSKQGNRWGAYHNGVDIAAKSGTRLDANISGKVVASGDAKKNGYHGSYGNIVVVQDKKGDKHLYGHLSKALVKIGDTVKKGQAIAKTGSTGRSTGPHLHYTINQGKKQAMPMVQKARGEVTVSGKSTTVTTQGVVDKTTEAISEARLTLNALRDSYGEVNEELEELNQMLMDSWLESYDRRVSVQDVYKEKRNVLKERSTGTSKYYRQQLNADIRGVDYQTDALKDKRKFINGTIKTKGITPKQKAILQDELKQIDISLAQYVNERANLANEHLESLINQSEAIISTKESNINKRAVLKERSVGDNDYYRKLLKNDNLDIGSINKKLEKEKKYIKNALTDKKKPLTSVQKSENKKRLKEIDIRIAQNNNTKQDNNLESAQSKLTKYDNKLSVSSRKYDLESSKQAAMNITSKKYNDSLNKQKVALQNDTSYLKSALAQAKKSLKSKNLSPKNKRILQEQIDGYESAIIDNTQKITDLAVKKLEVNHQKYKDKISKNDRVINVQSALQPLMNNTSEAYRNSLEAQKIATEEKAKTLKSEYKYALAQSKNSKIGQVAMKEQKELADSLALEIIGISQSLSEITQSKLNSNLAKNDEKVGDNTYFQSRNQTYTDSLLDNDKKKYSGVSQMIALKREANAMLIEDNKLLLASLDNKELTYEQKKANKDQMQANLLSVTQNQAEINNYYKDVAETIIDMYKQVYEKRRELELKAIDDERTAYQKLINDKITALQKLNAEDDHKESKSDYQKQIADLEKKIRNYNGDDSRSGKYEKTKAEEELENLKKEYSKFMRDYETENKIEAWQDDLSNKEDELDAATKATDKYFDNLANDERNFNKIRQEILKGNVDTFKTELSGMSEFIGKNMDDLGTSISETLIDQINIALMKTNALGADIASGGASGNNNGVSGVPNETGQINDNYVNPKPNSDGSLAKAEIKTIMKTPIYYTTSTGSKVLGHIPSGKNVPYTSYKDKWYKLTYSKLTGFVHQDDLRATSKKTETDKDGNKTVTTTVTDGFGLVSKSSTETSTDKLLGTTKTYDGTGTLTDTKYKQAKSIEEFKLLSAADKTSKTLEVLAKNTKISVLDVYGYYAKVKTDKGNVGYIPKSKLVGLATGGYTGDNVPQSGALAVLHKKELVLNAKQTEHILMAAKAMSTMGNVVSPTIPSTITQSNNEDNSTTNTFDKMIHIENFNGTRNEINNLEREWDKRMKRKGH